MEDRKLTDQLVAALGVQPENSTPSDKTIPNGTRRNRQQTNNEYKSESERKLVSK